MIHKKILESFDAVPSNPFVVGRPVSPEEFVGREYVVNVALDCIRQNSHLAISGDLGMGKSSLLKYLAAPKAWHERNLKGELSKTVIIDLNCGDIMDVFTPSGFWKELLSNLKRRFEGNDLIQSMLEESLQKHEVNSSDLKKVLRQMIRTKKKFLVLLIDNYDVALKLNRNYTKEEREIFLRHMRVLLANTENLSTVVTSTQPLNEYDVPPIQGSPFYNVYLFERLKPLEENEVGALFSRFNNVPIKFWLFLLDINCLGGIILFLLDSLSIRELADGYPALLQKVLNLLYHTRFHNRRPFDFQSFKQDCIEQVDYILSSIWEVCTQKERQYLMCLTLSKPTIRAHNQFSGRAINNFLTQNQEIGDKLANRGIVNRKKQEDKGRELYDFNFLLLKWWVSLKIKSGQENDLIQELENVLFGISRGELEKLAGDLELVFSDQLMSIINSIASIKN